MASQKILLVEDDQFIADMLETKLTESGYEVMTTADGNSVLSLLETNQPDVLLLDLMLPNKHGFVVLEEIRAHDQFKNLPVVILSNENGPDVETKAAAFNAHYYFKALTDISELLTSITKALESAKTTKV